MRGAIRKEKHGVLMKKRLSIRSGHDNALFWPMRPSLTSEWQKIREDILLFERELLHVLGFDFHVDHPHGYIMRWLLVMASHCFLSLSLPVFVLQICPVLWFCQKGEGIQDISGVFWRGRSILGAGSSGDLICTQGSQCEVKLTLFVFSGHHNS